MKGTEEIVAALRQLYDETQDWEDALGNERPSLADARRRVERALANLGGGK